MYASTFWCILQGVGYQVFQNRIHLILVKPGIHVAEITFISQADTFYVGISPESIDHFLHVGAQLIFGYI